MKATTVSNRELTKAKLFVFALVAVLTAIGGIVLGF
jgi:hypothetical protein